MRQKEERADLAVQANNIVLLALDQSSNINGYSIFENKQLIAHGIIKLGSGKLGKRLEKLKKEIILLIKEYNVSVILIEDIQLESKVVNNVKTYKTLAEVIGVLEELFTELKIPYDLTPASVWRSKIHIKGSSRAEQKRSAQLYVFEQTGEKVGEDESEAICIGVSYYLEDKTSESFIWN